MKLWFVLSMLNVAAQADPSSGKVNLTLGLIIPLDGIFGFSRIAAATTIAVEDAVREGFLENFDIRLDKWCLSCTTTVCECVRLCVRSRSCVCAFACMCACVRVCLQVCMCACVHTYKCVSVAGSTLRLARSLHDIWCQQVVYLLFAATLTHHFWFG